jgi:flagella basal body P-ring formation protein FlgA
VGTSDVCRRETRSASPDEEVRRTDLLLAEENGTRWTATATFVIPAAQALGTTVELAGDVPPGQLVQHEDVTLRLRPLGGADDDTLRDLENLARLKVTDRPEGAPIGFRRIHAAADLGVQTSFAGDEV